MPEVARDHHASGHCGDGETRRIVGVGHADRPSRRRDHLETELADRARWEAFLAPFYVLSSNLDVTWEYGRAYRYLQENGRLIGGNDLWIAATGLAYRMPIVTRPVEHDRRVPGLDVEKYRAPASRTQWHTRWLDAPARLPTDEPTDACMIPMLIPS